MKIYSFKVDEYFKLEKILYGQCFRWNKTDDNKYIGVVENNVIKIWQENNTIYFYGYNNKDIEYYVYDYFDLKTPYKKIIEDIKKKNNNIFLNEIIEYSKGTRILHQPKFEILISYIISASNNIPRIQGSIEKLSKLYGDKVVFENNDYYLFPTLKQLTNVTKKDYEDKIRVGFRGKYLESTVKNLLFNEYDLDIIGEMQTDIARSVLMKLDGVGPKVANCVLLFSMDKKDAFPIDIWIKRVMEKYSHKKHINKKAIPEIAQNDFGDYQGIINHYMFYWGRENKI